MFHKCNAYYDEPSEYWICNSVINPMMDHLRSGYAISSLYLNFIQCQIYFTNVIHTMMNHLGIGYEISSLYRNFVQCQICFENVISTKMAH